MKANGLLVEITHRVNDKTKKQSAVAQILFKDPAQLVPVTVNNTQVENGFYDVLKDFTGKEMDFCIKLEEFKFPDDNGKMVEITRMGLSDLPEQAQKALENRNAQSQQQREALSQSAAQSKAKAQADKTQQQKEPADNRATA
ncbi:hypothetical protein [Alteromonas sp. a30]|uniref:hypothetical protein n=1 Tax=Alteromonas sp. a30 TaxID=2730917 RepID=UPI002281E6CE|nr:hypothetical protein [Alteromonas sp. a30]MCY7295074.1 hypothetical protein [Alteromonas sp. a30]